MYEVIRAKIKEWQEKGIPVIFLRDQDKKGPSVSLTMLMISFSLCLFALINKFAKLVQGVDVENSLQLFGICAGLYFGRSFGKLRAEKQPRKED